MKYLIVALIALSPFSSFAGDGFSDCRKAGQMKSSPDKYKKIIEDCAAPAMAEELNSSNRYGGDNLSLKQKVEWCGNTYKGEDSKILRCKATILYSNAIHSAIPNEPKQDPLDSSAPTTK